ncbi:MAG TPA: hypothetical protein VJX67_24495 [Blastocatellia bacterium]|nr:hypothetical protein [Blastocatellia bacterium]
MTSDPQDIPDGRLTGQPDSTALRVRISHRGVSVLVLAISGSIIVYTAAGLIVVGARGEYFQPPQLKVPFYAAALFLALGSVALRRTQLRWLKLETIAGLRGAEGLIKHLARSTLILAVIGELIGLLGLVLSVVAGDKRDALTMGVVGLAVTLISYPRRVAWTNTVEYLASASPHTDAGSTSENII